MGCDRDRSDDGLQQFHQHNTQVSVDQLFGIHRSGEIRRGQGSEYRQQPGYRWHPKFRTAFQYLQSGR